MPEALVRLGELQWENEREGFVDRFEAWEKKPVDQRGPAPELDYRAAARSLRARAPATTHGSSSTTSRSTSTASSRSSRARRTRRSTRFERILKDYPQSRFVPDAHMAKAEAHLQRASTTTRARSPSTRRSSRSRTDRPALYGLALFKSAWCYWRLGNNDEAAKRFVGVFEATDDGAAARRASAAQRKQLDELQGEALKYLVEVFTEDEKNTAQDLYNFLTKIGGERVQRQDRPRARRAVLRPGALRARHRGLRAPPQARADEPRRGPVGAADRGGVRHARGLPARSRRPSSARSPQYTAGGPWSRTQGDPANVAATTDDDREGAARGRARRSTRKAQKDKTSRAEFEGAAGLYEVYLVEVRARSRRPTRSHFYLGEIDFFRLDKNLDAATHYMAAAQGRSRRARRTGAADDDAPRRALQRARRALARDATSQSSRRAKGEDRLAARRRGRQEVRRGARPLRAVLPDRPGAAGDVLPAGQATTSTTPTTTRP